jgi:hypothetical protein
MNLYQRLGVFCLLGGLCFSVAAISMGHFWLWWLSGAITVAALVGALIWIVGGGAALLVPNPLMVAGQRYAHIIEIMTQNVSLGVTAVLMLRPKRALVRVKTAFLRRNHYGSACYGVCGGGWAGVAASAAGGCGGSSGGRFGGRCAALAGVVVDIKAGAFEAEGGRGKRALQDALALGADQLRLG